MNMQDRQGMEPGLMGLTAGAYRFWVKGEA